MLVSATSRRVDGECISETSPPFGRGIECSAFPSIALLSTLLVDTEDNSFMSKIYVIRTLMMIPMRGGCFEEMKCKMSLTYLTVFNQRNFFFFLDFMIVFIFCQ